MSNPVPGDVGIGLGNLGFTGLVPAGPIAGVEGFVQALEFAPQTPSVPEPSSMSLSLVGTGLINRPPRLARILQVGDIYDALTNARPYKPAFTHQHTMDLILEEARRAGATRS